MVWYSLLFKNFPQFVVIHTVKGFGVVNEAEVDVFLELSCFFFVVQWMLAWRRKWQPSPVFLPGESQGQGRLVGCCLWGRTESDTTEETEQQYQKQQDVGNLISGSSAFSKSSLNNWKFTVHVLLKPGLENFGKAWQPTPVFLPGESHGQRSLAGYSLWDRKESDTTGHHPYGRK